MPDNRFSPDLVATCNAKFPSPCIRMGNVPQIAHCRGLAIRDGGFRGSYISLLMPGSPPHRRNQLRHKVRAERDHAMCGDHIENSILLTLIDLSAAWCLGRRHRRHESLRTEGNSVFSGGPVGWRVIDGRLVGGMWKKGKEKTPRAGPTGISARHSLNLIPGRQYHGKSRTSPGRKCTQYLKVTQSRCLHVRVLF